MAKFDKFDKKSSSRVDKFLESKVSSYYSRDKNKLARSTLSKKAPTQKSVSVVRKCKCTEQMRITKDAIKKSFKVKYEKRLKDMKDEFTLKFKNNEKVWKQRMDYQKHIFKKEQEKT